MRTYGRIACTYERQAFTHMNRTLRLLAAIAFAMVLLAPLASQAGDKKARAVDTVHQLLNQAHESIAGRGSKQLSGAISPFFAFEVWARFLTQPRKQQFTPEQMQTLRQLLPGYMARLYREQLAKGLNSKPSVGGAHRVRKDHLVESWFQRPSGNALPVQWRVRSFRGGQSRVIDIMVGGTSFMILKREEFTAKVDQSGPEGLLNYLRRIAD